jgi:hypothetical protein
VAPHIEKINEPFLCKLMGTPAEYKAGLERAIAWLRADYSVASEPLTPE